MKLQKIMIRSFALVLGLAVAVSGFSGCGFWNRKTVPVSMSVKYDASDAVGQALERLSEHPSEQAALLSGVEAVEKVFALTFDGFASPDAMAQVLALLDRYQVKAAFFVTGMEAAEGEDIILNLAEKGHLVECGTLYGLTHLDEKSTTELVADFAHARVILGDILGKEPDLLKCRSTVYSDNVLSAAASAGFQYAVQSNQYISYQSFKNYESALGYVSRLERGSILTIRLSGVLDEDEYGAAAKTKDAYMPGERRPGIGDGGLTASDTEKRLLQEIEWVLKAAEEAGYQIVLPTSLKSVQSFELDSQARQAQYLQYRQENRGRLAGLLDMVYTTERAAALTFYGVGNQETLDGVLTVLAQLGAQGTFFVSAQDINEYPDAVKKIVEAGHEVGAAILPKKGLDYAAVCEQLYLVQSLMKLHYNVEVRLAGQVYDAVPPEVREAVAAMGLRLVGYSGVVDTSGSRGGARNIIDALFKSANYTIKRGQILYFRMDYERQVSGLAAQVLRLLYTNVLQNTAGGTDGTLYALKGVSRLTGGTGTYLYPVPDRLVAPEVQSRIFAGHLQSKSALAQSQYIRTRYIGNPDVSTTELLPGFAKKELSNLDTTGKINTKGANVIFLTFDDWGTDRSVNRLLDVLQKYGVKATFFVRTAYVGANPNLLRAIGEQGHEIASHTDGHLPLANYTADNKVSSITAGEAQTLEQDVIRSYRALQSVVGDLRNEKGRPVLTTLFRPPTLSVSKTGLETVFDCGYTYSISGDFSTADYQAGSAEKLFKLLAVGMPVSGQDELRTISAGSVVVMHMTDNARYTPEALDRFLSWNAAQPAESRFAFARIGDYLQQ
ncbi:Polysaccharide deacetylase [anaerobic digester metagenome]